MNTKFSDAILAKKSTGKIPVIPDIKCISPEYGDLLKGRDPVEVAMLLESIGAPAISVVTETKNFGGSLELLRKIANSIKVPILRKDFITDIDDLKRTKDCGADAVLLMCAVQSEKLLFYLYEQSLRIGLEPLVEAHTQAELLLIKKLGATLVGINNRNILELEKDDGTVSATSQLISYAPKEAIVISESSIGCICQAQQAIDAGAHAVLIGTAIWQAADMCDFYTSLCNGKVAD